MIKEYILNVVEEVKKKKKCWKKNTNKSNYSLIGHICKSFVVDIIYNAHRPETAGFEARGKQE